MIRTHHHLQTIHGHLNEEDILHRGLHARQDRLRDRQGHTQGQLHVLHTGKNTLLIYF